MVPRIFTLGYPINRQGGITFSFERIFVPTDGTEAAHEAARVGAERAEPLNATPVFIGVADVSLATSNTYIASTDEDRMIAKLEEEAEGNVERLADEIETTTVDYKMVVEDGIPKKQSWTTPRTRILTLL